MDTLTVEKHHLSELGAISIFIDILKQRLQQPLVSRAICVQCTSRMLCYHSLALLLSNLFSLVTKKEAVSQCLNHLPSKFWAFFSPKECI